MRLVTDPDSSFQADDQINPDMDERDRQKQEIQPKIVEECLTLTITTFHQDLLMLDKKKSNLFMFNRSVSSK